MLCYKDMTFCSYYESCRNGVICDRTLTEEVVEAARKTGLNISAFMSKPFCFKEIEGDEDE